MRNENIKKLYECKELNEEKLNKEKRVILTFPPICSLQCKYCVSNMWKRDGIIQHGIIQEIGLDEYLKRIDYLFKKYYPLIFVLGGGEPTENPYFFDTTKYILESGNSLHLITNLSHTYKIVELSKIFPKETMKKISITSSYHLGAFLDKKNSEKLRNKFLYESIPQILSCGIEPTNIVIPLTPKVVFDEKFLDELKYLRSKGFTTDPVELVHIYNGKHYPESYTEKESIRIQEIMNYVDSKPRIKDSKQVKYFISYLCLKGLPCAISNFLCNISAKGIIENCRGNFIGNINDYKNTRQIFYDTPTLCNIEQCKCKTLGKRYSLDLYNISYPEYFNAYYKDMNKPEISKLFKE